MNKKNEKWNEWFAGLTDGDGCFYINKETLSISFELTTHITDNRLLTNIKNTLKAGSVKPRSNSLSARYRVKSKEAIIDIVHRLNGKLYNKARLEQFSNVCKILEIQQLNSDSVLDKKNAYLAGLIDSDGTITISVSHSSYENSQKSGVEGRILRVINSKAHNQLSLKVTSIYKDNLEMIKNSYDVGKIYEEKASKKQKSSKPKYHWTIKSYTDFVLLYEYLKTFPLKSVKMHRIRLCFIYFKYKTLKYHLSPPGTIEYKLWEKFCRLWYKYSF
jgi:hypothetical protein